MGPGVNGRLPPRTTFAIIGAGAAGLTSARTLLEAGYHNITIVEAEETAGGKCLTVEVEGRPFDLGCLAGSETDYREVLSLAAAHGTRAVRFAVTHFSLTRGHAEPLFTRRERLRLLRELLTCARLHFVTWRGIRTGEMTGLSDELCDTFADLVARHGLRMVERKVRGMFIACGFGPPEALAAAYAVNYASPRMLLSPDALFTWSHGAQAPWQREAAALAERGVQFRYGARVTDICRDAVPRIVMDDGTALVADELIVAVDPTLLPIDASAAERAVFSQVRHVDYRVLLCRVDGLPAAAEPTMYFLEDNLVAGREGRPMALFRRHAGQNVCAVYCYGAGLRDETLLANLSQDLAAIGCRLAEHLGTQAWLHYFPHFSGVALRAGVLDDLYALQGDRHTTYVGESLNFAILPRIVDNARLTMRRLMAGGTNGRLAAGAP